MNLLVYILMTTNSVVNVKVSAVIATNRSPRELSGLVKFGTIPGGGCRPGSCERASACCAGVISVGREDILGGQTWGEVLG